MQKACSREVAVVGSVPSFIVRPSRLYACRHVCWGARIRQRNRSPVALPASAEINSGNPQRKSAMNGQGKWMDLMQSNNYWSGTE